MRLARAFRRFVVAVESQAMQRTPRQSPTAPDPEAGARWGRPATFDVASRNRESNEACRLLGKLDRQLPSLPGNRDASRVRPRGGVRRQRDLEPETIRSVTFYSGTREDRRDVGVVIFTSLIEDAALPADWTRSRSEQRPSGDRDQGVTSTVTLLDQQRDQREAQPAAMEDDPGRDDQFARDRSDRGAPQ